MIYDTFASKIAEDFEMFRLALAGRYYKDVNANIRITPRAVGDLHKDALTIAQSFVATVKTDVNKFAQAVGGESAHKHAINAFMYRASTIAMECVSTIMKRRRGGEQVTSILGDASGGIGMLLQRNASEVEFYARDSAGRRWKAAAIIRLEARNFAHKAHIKNSAAQLSQVSDLAKVVYPDPNHADFGMIVSLSGESKKYPSLASVMGSIFHPNSTATLVHV